jgi:hypothetical protein
MSENKKLTELKNISPINKKNSVMDSSIISGSETWAAFLVKFGFGSRLSF